jgi:Helix-turn-helix domain
MRRNSKAANQQQQVYERLCERGRLSTIEARNELFVMSIAARIFELREAGHNIATHKINVGSKKIAEYVLYAGKGNV